MPNKNEHNGSPQFDFSRLSWKDGKALDLARAKISKGAATGDPEMLQAGFDEMEAYFAKVIEYVPQDWLVSDAPDNLRWDDPDSFNWLLGYRAEDLIIAMGEAQQERKKK
jgi:hypothetical protein